MYKYLGLLFLAALISCKGDKKSDTQVVEETRTSGTLTMFVDDTFAPVIQAQERVFFLDYPKATFTTLFRNEKQLVPAFLNDSVRVAVMSRDLTPEETEMYTKRGIIPRVSRFAIDGIALINQKNNPDSTIRAEEVVQIFKGNNPSGKKLVFDNAYSSTLRYFMELAQVKEIPAKGVFTLKNNNDVIKYVAENTGYIGVIGVNWLSEKNDNSSPYIKDIKMLGVQPLAGKKPDTKFYKPEQTNLIGGIYPFVRNIYIVNCEARNGLGSGFANWLVGQRGQLIVLKSGLGPHRMPPRELNFKN